MVDGGDRGIEASDIFQSCLVIGVLKVFVASMSKPASHSSELNA